MSDQLRVSLYMVMSQSPKPKGIVKNKKGRDLTQSYDKSPNTQRKKQKATQQHKNATKNLDYTTIADRLRLVSWSDDSHT